MEAGDAAQSRVERGAEMREPTVGVEESLNIKKGVRRRERRVKKNVEMTDRIGWRGGFFSLTCANLLPLTPSSPCVRVCVCVLRKRPSLLRDRTQPS